MNLVAARQREPTIVFSPDSLNYAERIVIGVCCLAGDSEYLHDLRTSFSKHRFFSPENRQDSAKLFEWLMHRMSYQGISDQAARTYMERHGFPQFEPIARSLNPRSMCPKLRSYWDFTGCQYRKTEQSCSMPEHFHQCSLPRHEFRNGNLNQLAYSFALFMRDIADGDLVGWIDSQVGHLNDRPPETAAEALVQRLRGLHGVSDKVINMVFADLLLAGGSQRPGWTAVGASMIAVDTLVHNFLHRTGILKAAKAEHLYGSQCYGENGCEAIIRVLAAKLDARTFNPRFPPYFPRFVQRSIWRYCSQEGLGVCNGHNVDDRRRCKNSECLLYLACRRVSLRG